MDDKRIAVIYGYYERDKIYIDNLNFFLSHGYTDDKNFMFVFVVNGESTVSFPTNENVKVIFRENSNYVFAQYNCGARWLEENNIMCDYYVYINKKLIIT